MKSEAEKSNIRIPSTPQPTTWLRDVFLERKHKNSAYSLRAFARDLGLSQTLLSLVLNGKRPLTLKQAHKVCALIGFTSTQQKTFLDATLAALPENAKISQKLRDAREKQDYTEAFTDIDIEKFNTIANWYHFAILDLTSTKDFQPTPGWIAKRLGISKLEVESAINRLLNLGLLKQEKRTLKKTSVHLRFSTKNSKAAIRSFHEQMLDKAKTELKKTDDYSFSKRAIIGSSFSIDASRIEEAKQVLEDFRADFLRRFTFGEPQEVYQINLQLFPLSQTVNK